MRRVIQVALLLAILLNSVFWTLWFTKRELISTNTDAGYLEFENSFPLADLWLLIACAAALYTLTKRMPSAFFWLVCAGAVAIYLGLLDLLHALNEDVFTKGAEGIIELFIVIAAFALGIACLRYAWGHRGDLLSGDSGD